MSKVQARRWLCHLKLPCTHGQKAKSQTKWYDFFYPNEQKTKVFYCWIWAFSDKMHPKTTHLKQHPSAWSKETSLFAFFSPAATTVQPLRQPSESKLYLFMSGKPQWKCEAEATQREIPFSFTFSFLFFRALTLTPQGAELQRALINGSCDAPARRHSLRHNRRSREAEQGMEYWRIEWKHTQHRRAGVSPVLPQSPTHCCVFVLRRL